MNKILLEICIDSIESAKAAIEGGADRLEVCSALELDGLTPTTDLIKEIQSISDIVQFVMIRPREGNFIYSDQEFELMKQQLNHVKELKVQGIVSGILTTDLRIDKQRTKELVDLASPLSFTFHRAFDEVMNQQEALDDLMELGIDTVLTSGGKPTAYEGITELKQLVDQAKSNITILAGSGINDLNVSEIITKTGVTQVHGSASEKVKAEESKLYKRLTKYQKVKDLKERIK